MSADTVPGQEDKLSKIARTYFNTVIPASPIPASPERSSGKRADLDVGKDFLLQSVEKKGANYILHLITYRRNTNEFPPTLEDNLRSIFSTEGVSFLRGGLEVEKVTRGEFIKKSIEWGSVLGRKLGYSVSDISDAKQYTIDLLSLAKDMRASDIHISPNSMDRNSGMIKFRIDGRLREIDSFGADELRKLLDHIHSLNSERASQGSKETRVLEGGFYIEGDTGTKYRSSSMQISTGFGREEGLGAGTKIKSYSLTLRLLKTENIKRSLDELGYLPEDREKVLNLIKERSGFILATGTTDTGKTTTLGSIVNRIAEQCNGEKKIITFEDPVEYHLKALQFHVTKNENQDQVLTFPLALENCLRQDPDVVMIGEVRNSKTAEYMIEAAQTGHLILATLHSKDPTSAIIRLGGYGIKGPAMNDSLLGIISQILIGKNCPQCIKKRPMTEEEVDYFFQPSKESSAGYEEFRKDILGFMVAESTGEYQGKVCPKCEGFKHYGRLPLVQIYVHSVEYAPIISALCNGDPGGPAQMIKLFMEGKQQPFALNAIYNLLHQRTSPKELMQLPPSYFTNYSSLIIKKTEELIQKQKEQAKP